MNDINIKDNIECTELNRLINNFFGEPDQQGIKNYDNKIT